jgi:hypothetical protein
MREDQEGAAREGGSREGLGEGLGGEGGLWKGAREGRGAREAAPWIYICRHKSNLSSLQIFKGNLSTPFCLNFPPAPGPNSCHG